VRPRAGLFGIDLARRARIWQNAADIGMGDSLMKATLLAALLAGSLLPMAAATAQSLTNDDTPVAPAPFHETLFGTEIDDPYRWMEDPARQADVTAYIRAANAHTTAELAALPGRARLRERTVAGFQSGVRFADADVAGDHIFFRRTDPDSQLAKLVMRGPDGAERVLYDPEAGGQPGPALNNYSLSPDGKLLAYHTAGGGAEVGAIRFIDLATGETLPDRLEPVWGEFEADWIGPRAVAYTRMADPAPGVDPMLDMRVMLHEIGATGSDTVLLGTGADGPAFAPQEFPLTFSSGISDWTIGFWAGARADARIFVARKADLAAGRPSWREIGGYEDRIGYAELIGDTLYLLSTKNDPNGSVLALDLAGTGGLAGARTVLPAGDLVLTGMAAARDGLYVAGQVDGISHLLFLPGGAGPARELPLPIQGNLGGLFASADDEGAVFTLQDWFTAPRNFVARAGMVTSLGLDSASYAGAGAFTHRTEQAVSADGTRVPMAILLPANSGGRSLPMVLEGYGSYGTNTAEPYYARAFFGFLEEGGAIAFCGTRGGGERGRAWHEAGRAANKPNAHADLIACGERLVALGLTRPGMLTVMGSSAGGLLAAPAALKRPDLFRSLVANVAMLNPIRLAVAPNGPNQFGEMGDPGTAEGFAGLLSADSYQMLASAADMPDTLLLVGLNDHRVAPWFTTKFAARARDRFGDRHLVLIRSDPEAGHGIGSTNDQLIEMYADVGAFVFNRAGVQGFTTP